MSELRDLQLVQLEILKEIDKICEKHNINYFLYGGTLLGAIRHNGFIPWDDDLDIAMLRKDYEKLEKIVSDELDSKFFFQSLKTDLYPHFIAKVRLNGTTFIESLTRHMKIHHGVFIDILILDNVPESIHSRKIYQMLLTLIYTIISSKVVYYDYSKFNLRKKIMGKILKFMTMFIPLNPAIELYKRLELNYANSNTDFVGQTSKAKPYRRCYKKDTIFPIQKVKFEDGYYSAPSNVDEMLKIDFGDYMQLPPKEKRVSKHGFIIDLENNYTHYLLNDLVKK